MSFLMKVVSNGCFSSGQINYDNNKWRVESAISKFMGIIMGINFYVLSKSVDADTVKYQIWDGEDWGRVPGTFLLGTRGVINFSYDNDNEEKKVIVGYLPNGIKEQDIGKVKQLMQQREFILIMLNQSIILNQRG